MKVVVIDYKTFQQGRNYRTFRKFVEDRLMGYFNDGVIVPNLSTQFTIRFDNAGVEEMMLSAGMMKLRAYTHIKAIIRDAEKIHEREDAYGREHLYWYVFKSLIEIDGIRYAFYFSVRQDATRNNEKFIYSAHSDIKKPLSGSVHGFPKEIPFKSSTTKAAIQSYKNDTNMTINSSNYYEQIKNIDFSTAPEPLVKTRAFVDTVTANGSSWAKYESNPAIKKTIDLYFDRLGQFAAQQKPKEEKKWEYQPPRAIVLEPEKKKGYTKADVLNMLTPNIKNFFPRHQLQTITEHILKSEEAEYFVKILKEFDKRISEMPATYDTEKIKSADKPVTLHYFSPSGDWYIVERDKGDGDDGGKQFQAWGYADLGHGDGGEWGYISIVEMLDIPQVELDLHFNPQKFSAIKNGRYSDIDDTENVQPEASNEAVSQEKKEKVWEVNVILNPITPSERKNPRKLIRTVTLDDKSTAHDAVNVLKNEGLNIKKVVWVRLQKSPKPKAASRKPQAKKAKTSNSKLQTKHGNIERVDEEHRIIKRFVALHGREKTDDDVLSFLNYIQRAILERRVTKKGKYADEVTHIQNELVKVYNDLIEGGKKKTTLTLSPKELDHYGKIAGAQKPMNAIALLKRYVSMNGRKVTKEKAEILSDQIVRASEQGKIEPKYKKQLIDAYNNLLDFLKTRKSGSALTIEPATLNGLGKMLKMDVPDWDNDDFISDSRNGYSVSRAGMYIGEESDFDDAMKLLLEEREGGNWFPTIWFVNERGNYYPIDENGNEIKGVGRPKSAHNRDHKYYNKREKHEQQYAPMRVKKQSYAIGRPKSALMRDRKYTSQQEHEKAYTPKRVSEVRRYKGISCVCDEKKTPKAVLFGKKLWSKKEANEWLKKFGLKGVTDESKSYWRYREEQQLGSLLSATTLIPVAVSTIAHAINHYILESDIDEKFTKFKERFLGPEKENLSGIATGQYALSIEHSPIHGKGLFADDAIPAGEEITSAFTPEFNTLCRMINHCDTPNATGVMCHDRAVIQAKRNISPGEEITLDYSAWNRTMPAEFYITPLKKKETLSGMISSEELMKMSFETIGLQGKWNQLIGDPAPGFSILAYGSPGTGKSTLMLQFARHLAEHHGRVLYVSAEDALPTVKIKMVRHGISAHPNLIIVSEMPKSFDGFEYIFIDSATVLKIGGKEIEEIRKKHPQKSFVFIAQAIKTGKYAGDADMPHNVDIVICVEKERAYTEKSRYGSGEIILRQQTATV